MRHHDETGALSIEIVILLPIVLALTFIAPQLALVYTSRNVAQAAAQEAVEVARRDGGTASAGEDAAHQYLANLGTKALTSTDVSSTRDADEATVTVTATVTRILPFYPAPTIHERASGPVERYVPAGGG